MVITLPASAFPQSLHEPVEHAGDWHLSAVNNLAESQDLLDCLEANGHPDRQMVVLDDGFFAVRWR